MKHLSPGVFIDANLLYRAFKGDTGMVFVSSKSDPVLLSNGIANLLLHV